jgi:hypothetical protein
MGSVGSGNSPLVISSPLIISMLRALPSSPNYNRSAGERRVGVGTLGRASNLLDSAKTGRARFMASREMEKAVTSRFVKGTYVSGFQHSTMRPKLYEHLRLWQGTINIQLPHDVAEDILIPSEIIPSFDAVDSNQNFRIRACSLKGVDGYQILPIDKETGAPKGHYAAKQIEVSLKDRIDLRPHEELEVELQGFEG